MDVGIFAVPFRLPETGTKQGLDWDIEVTKWAEEFGFSEAWYAEHYTLGWENTCAPELIVAAAAQQTSKIKLAIGANLLPYHNPIALAHRLMQLDHMTGGRLIAGFGAGGYATDAQLFGLPDLPERRKITAEAIDVILDIWTRERPYKHEGEYFKVDYPAYDKFWGGPNWRPAQRPHPQAAIAGISASSSSLKDAGKRGFIPMSFDLDPQYLLGHWQAYEEGAKEAGRTANRKDWRLFKTVVVGRTDEEAVELACSKPVTRVFDEFVLRVYESFGLLGSFAPGVPEKDITSEYLAKNIWLVGSVDTVVQKIEAFYKTLGGFGVLVTPTFDFFDNVEGYRNSLRLLGQEVKPQLAKLSA